MPHRHCSKCEKPAVTRCSKCRVAWYCTIDCQKAHWRIHKQDCSEGLLQRFDAWCIAWLQVFKEYELVFLDLPNHPERFGTHAVLIVAEPRTDDHERFYQDFRVVDTELLPAEEALWKSMNGVGVQAYAPKPDKLPIYVALRGVCGRAIHAKRSHISPEHADVSYYKSIRPSASMKWALTVPLNMDIAVMECTPDYARKVYRVSDRAPGGVGDALPLLQSAGIYLQGSGVV